MNKILVTDDDLDFCSNLSVLLQENGFEVMTAATGREALEKIQGACPDLVLLDLRLPDIDGMNVLQKIKGSDPDLDIIVITAYMDVKDAIRAIKLGAYDYVTKPFDDDELLLTISKAFTVRQLRAEIDILKKRLGEKLPVEKVMGDSPQIKKVLTQVDIVAPTDFTVIIQGASGTGKEVVANLIHQKSLRKDNAFIPIDCSAIPETLIEAELFGHEKGAFTGADRKKEGKFELANEGTLFLDEIANLSEAMQAKLLRVLQERKLQHLGGNKDIKINARLIAASKVNLFDAMKQGKFRDDLYYRLNEFLIEIPKLGEREGDVAFFANYFLEKSNQELHKNIRRISSAAMRLLFQHPWPGNVRELKNTIRRAALVAASAQITPADILLEQTDSGQSRGSDTATRDEERVNSVLDGSLSLKEMTNQVAAEIEKEVIRKALLKTGGNKSRTAKVLKIERVTLYAKLKELKIEP
ncbi:MAG: sigma-54 dependent transcriptional regulator [Candidatus Aminicenantes bacterium]|nr:sigma-54 dependent transcriptional regulator [Candidatus Aminicenantes bacterium]